jgi:hypothetical protein
MRQFALWDRGEETFALDSDLAALVERLAQLITAREERRP